MANEVKRMNYYNGLFLKEEDFITDQEYHIRMRRLVNWHLNKVYGIMEGLEVKPVLGSKSYKVTAGIALSYNEEEWKGVEIVLAEDKEADLSSASTGETYLTIAYNEEKADIAADKGPKEIHIAERPKIELKPNPDKKKEIVLAKITVPPGAWTSDPKYLDFGERMEIGPSIRSINGKTGIGTTTPKNTLDVEGGAVIGASYSGNNTAPDNGLLVEGKVGLGVASPVEKLEVNGNVKATSFTGDGSKLTGTSKWLDASGGDIYYNKGEVGIGTANPAGNQLDISSSQGGANNSAIRALYPGGGGLLGTEFAALAHRAGAWTALFARQGAGSSAAFFDGKVGIGIASPSKEMEVNGTVKATSFEGDGSKLTGISTGVSSQWGDVADGAIYYAKGNVGIGTATPTQKLEVIGNLKLPLPDTFIDFGADVRQMINLWGNGPNAAYGIGVQAGTQYFRTAAHFAWYQGGIHSDTELDPGAGGSAVMVIKRGNVGIGTNAPSHKFHVVAPDAVGLFESTGTQAYLRLSTNEGMNNRVEITNRPGGRLSLWTAVGGDIFNITRDGNIGIGTITPLAGAALDVRSKSTIVCNGLYFYGSGLHSDNMPFARLIESWGMRFNSPDGRWVLSSNPSVLIGYQPNGTNYGFGNLFVSGNVGIGTLTPGSKLTVAGSIAGGETTTGWVLGAGAWGPDTWLRLTTTQKGSTYHDLAINQLWSSGAKRFDLAEVTPVREDDDLEIGEVVVIDKEDGLRVTRSKIPYDTSVYGIVSSYEQASMIIGGAGPESVIKVKDKLPIALMGRVKARISAEGGAIQAGDLLTTSSTPGHLMKCKDISRSKGAVAAKALEAHERGKGEITVLVTLQ